MKVLVVDDSKAFCQDISRLLTKEGYEVYFTDDSDIVSAFCKNQGIDICITRISDDERKTLRIFRGIRDNAPETRVIAMSHDEGISQSIESTIAIVNIGVNTLLSRHRDIHSLKNAVSREIPACVGLK